MGQYAEPLALYLALSGWVAAAVIFLGWRQHVNQLKDNLDGFRATNSKLALENSELKRKLSRKGQPRKENGQFAKKEAASLRSIQLGLTAVKRSNTIPSSRVVWDVTPAVWPPFSDEAFNGEMGRK